MSKAKRPKADDRFNIDELANSPSLYGIEDAYRRFTTGPQLVEKRLATELSPLTDATAVEGGADSSGAVKLGAVNVGAAITGAPDLPAARPPAPTLGAPVVAAPSVDPPPYTYGDYEIYQRREYRPVPATTVQDGHTHGQQSVYSTIWRLGKVYGQNAKAVAIGERTLAAEVPMSYSSLQDNVRALLEKHAIEIQTRGPNKSKLYIAYSYDEILRRRRSLGLTHVIRRTTGVTLCTSSGAPSITAPPLASGAPSSGALDQSSGAPSLPGSGAPSFGEP